MQTTQTKNGVGSKKREICASSDHGLRAEVGWGGGGVDWGWMMKPKLDKFLFHQTAAEVWDQDAT